MLNYDIKLFLTQQPSHKMFPISESIGGFVLESGSSLLVWTGWLLLSLVPPSGMALFDLPVGSHCTATNPSTPTQQFSEFNIRKAGIRSLPLFAHIVLFSKKKRLTMICWGYQGSRPLQGWTSSSWYLGWEVWIDTRAKLLHFPHSATPTMNHSVVIPGWRCSTATVPMALAWHVRHVKQGK